MIATDGLRQTTNVAALPVSFQTSSPYRMSFLFLFSGFLLIGILSVHVVKNKGFVPFEHRTAIPWKLTDILLLLFLFFVLLIANGVLIGFTLALSGHADSFRADSLQPRLHEASGRSVSSNAVSIGRSGESAAEIAKQHPLTQLVLQVKDNPAIMLLVILCAVVAAPLGEEFFFRLLLQGWLQHCEWDRRRLLPFPAWTIGVFPVGSVALFFALIHFRNPGAAPPPVGHVVLSLLSQLTATCATFLFGIFYLRIVRKATLRDFGIDLSRILPDVRTGLFFLALLLPPMILIQKGLHALLPDVTTDPVPLFFFAIALGLLYFRSQRIVAGLVLHAALNGVMLFLLFTLV